MKDHPRREPYWFSSESYIRTDNSDAWGWVAGTHSGRRADTLRGWVRPTLKGHVEVRAWSAAAVLAELCPDGPIGVWCDPPRVPPWYDASDILIEVTSRDLSGAGAGVDVAIEGVSITRDDRFFSPNEYPQIPTRPDHIDREVFEAIAATFPIEPRPPEPSGLGMLVEILLTGGISVVIRAAASTAESAESPEQAELARRYDEAVMQAAAEQQKYVRREVDLMIRIFADDCSDRGCHRGYLMNGESFTQGGSSDGLHLLLSYSWGTCRLLDVLHLPLDDADVPSQSLDGVQVTLPTQIGWDDMVEL